MHDVNNSSKLVGGSNPSGQYAHQIEQIFQEFRAEHDKKQTPPRKLIDG